MRYTELGKTGIKVSVLSCGSNALRGRTQEEANIAYNRALDSGINLIETGRPYGDETESLIAGAVSHRRDEFYLASKTGEATAEKTMQDIDKSLEMLRTGYLDIFQVAGIDNQERMDNMLGAGGSMEAILEAKAAGKIGYVGITGHNPKALAEVIRMGEIDTVLFILNMVYRESLGELVPLAKKMGVGMMVMRPISHGELGPVSKSMAYVLTSGIDTAVCGMYSAAEVDENVAVANIDFTPSEIESLQAEGASLSDNGCNNCGKCSCPQGIDIPYLLKMTPYRDKYELLKQGEGRWQKQAENAKKCDDCMKCEEACPYDLSIADIIHKIANR